MKSTLTFDELDIEVSQDVTTQWTRGHHVPDRSWTHVDSHGHEHAFFGSDLPTLEWVITRTYWCEECRDEHEEGKWRCRQCGDVVSPVWLHTGPYSFLVPGLREVAIVVRRLGVVETYLLRGDEAHELLNAVPGDRMRPELERRARAIVARRDPDEWKGQG